MARGVRVRDTGSVELLLRHLLVDGIVGDHDPLSPGSNAV